jgi:hypothetical protein
MNDYENYFTHIKKNCVKCLNCGCIIESKHRHDFVWCDCGNIAADGGTSYIKRSGNYRDMQEMCESVRFSKDELQTCIYNYEINLANQSTPFDTKYTSSAKHFLNLWYPD